MPPQFLRKTINGIEYLEIPGNEEGKTILLFHGYGADAFDLLPISQIYKSDPSITWLFPFAPLDIEIMPGYIGKSWFPIDIQALREAVQAQKPEAITKAFPGEILHARATGETFINGLKLSPNKTFIGGFSQGAVLATEIALHSEESFAGLIILSGTLINSKQWSMFASKHKNTRFFQSHGNYDPILPVKAAKDLAILLQQGGMKGNLHLFNGGHEIPAGMLIQLRNFLESH